MRRYLLPTIVLAVIGFVVGGLYRHFVDPAAEENVGNYLRSAVHSSVMVLTGWAVHLYFTSDQSAWVRRWPLILELFVRSAVTALLVAAAAIVMEAILYSHGITESWLLHDYPLIIGLLFLFSTQVGAIYELTRLVGSRVLVNVILGRYRRPTREARVLLFLDLVGSTTLAEEMGELRVQELLTRFFFDIDAAITAHGGEVHAYVGDEVIVTWPLQTWRAGARPDNRYVDCVFAIRDLIAARADWYAHEFGLVPKFRAGLHAGPVVISQCGDSRREVAYFGDTMNVAARLQAHCKEAGRALLVSGEVMRLLPPREDLIVDALGPTQLRGRAAAVEVFAIARRLLERADEEAAS